MGTTSHKYVERAKEQLARVGGLPGTSDASAHAAVAYATLAVAAELHDLNQHLRGTSNGVPALTQEATQQ